MKRTIMYIFIAIIIVALVFSVGLLKEKDNSDSNLKTIQLNEVTKSLSAKLHTLYSMHHNM